MVGPDDLEGGDDLRAVLPGVPVARLVPGGRRDHRPGGGGGPPARHLAVPRRRRATRRCASSGSSRPTSTPTSCPVTSSWPSEPARPSPTATPPAPEFEVELLHDGQRLSLGEVAARDPDHAGPHARVDLASSSTSTPTDEVPYAVLTGDTLFIGDVGRPDLLTSVGVTADDLARQLYRSLHDKLLTLPDATRVFPAHGAGSACGKQLSTENVSTIGEQRRTNYALAPMAEDEFVEAVTEGQPRRTALLRLRRRPSTSSSARRSTSSAAPAARPRGRARAARARGAVVLDTRDEADFAAGHLARLGQRRARRSLRRVRRRRACAPTRRSCSSASRAPSSRPRCGSPASASTRVVGYLARPRAPGVLEHPEQVERASRVDRPRPARALPRRRRPPGRRRAQPGRGRPRASSRARSTSRWPSITTRADELDPARPDRRVLRRRLPLQHRGQLPAARRASPTCPTCSAATARSAEPVALEEVGR